MKDYQNYLQPPLHQRSFWKTSANHLRDHKLAAYVILLILTYALGYFTPSLSSKHHLITHDRLNKNKIEVEIEIPPSTVTELPITVHLPRHHQSSTKATTTTDSDPFAQNQPDPSPHSPVTKAQESQRVGIIRHRFETLIKKTQPKTIIEVGTFLGASATHMAELTRKLGLETQILCLDDFRGWPGFRDKTDYVPIQNGDVLLLAQFMQNVMYLNYSEIIMPIPYSTSSGLRKLCEWGVYGDLIEVDAGHDFHSAWSDINLAHKLLNPSGVMFGHDYLTSADNKGVKRAVDLFAKVHGFKVYVDGQHWVLTH
ncbi:1-(5-phosphoribosyl)-5-[(5-phosphoribosylamino)methylideneamino] imidazole-4-carboxamide isomerase [Bienertia sinuspersici]